MAQPRTLEELAAMPGLTVGTGAVHSVLGVDRYTLNIMAREGKLPYACFFSGNRLHIVKSSFLEFMGYKEKKEKEDHHETL